MLEPYEDLPTGLGHNTTSPEAIRAAAELMAQGIGQPILLGRSEVVQRKIDELGLDDSL